MCVDLKKMNKRVRESSQQVKCLSCVRRDQVQIPRLHIKARHGGTRVQPQFRETEIGRSCRLTGQSVQLKR